MDGDDGAQTTRRPACDHDVLVLEPREAFERSVRIRDILLDHKGILRRIGQDRTRPRAQERGASTVKAIVETAASLLSRPTSVTSTCSTKLDRPRRTIWASARAGPTTTGDRKWMLRSDVAVLNPFSWSQDW